MNRFGSIKRNPAWNPKKKDPIFPLHPVVPYQGRMASARAESCLVRDSVPIRSIGILPVTAGIHIVSIVPRSRFEFVADSCPPWCRRSSKGELSIGRIDIRVSEVINAGQPPNPSEGDGKKIGTVRLLKKPHCPRYSVFNSRRCCLGPATQEGQTAHPQKTDRQRLENAEELNFRDLHRIGATRVLQSREQHLVR